MSKPKVALNPKHPERICWGCDKYCSADDLRCGNGTIRTQHPVELFGEDWLDCELGSEAEVSTGATEKIPEQADPAMTACENLPHSDWSIARIRGFSEHAG